MKKSFVIPAIILLSLLIASCNANAQFAKMGVVELGGAISYSSSALVTDGTVASEKTTILNFMPYINYFIVDGFSVALSPGINVIKIAGESNSITNLNLFAVPGYTFSTNSPVYPYIEAMLGYTSVSSDATNPITESGNIDYRGFSWGGKAGLKVLIGKNGLLSIGVAYTALNYSPQGADKRTGINNLAVSMGFSVFAD